MNDKKPTKEVHQVRVWGTPFTVTFRQYGRSGLGDVHGHGIAVHRNIDLHQWLGQRHDLLALARRVENQKFLRRLRHGGSGFQQPKRRGMGARPTPGHPVQVGYVVTDAPPVRFQEIKGCLHPIV